MNKYHHQKNAIWTEMPLAVAVSDRYQKKKRRSKRKKAQLHCPRKKKSGYVQQMLCCAGGGEVQGRRCTKVNYETWIYDCMFVRFFFFFGSADSDCIQSCWLFYNPLEPQNVNIFFLWFLFVFCLFPNILPQDMKKGELNKRLWNC